MGWGGTKLAFSNPCSNKSAIHSASFTSVLRPGTFLMRWALATVSSKSPSRMAYTGFQYTPVDSMATCVQPSACNHSQRHQLVAGGAELPNVLLDFPVGQDDQQTSHHCGLMHVQSTTSLN